MSQLEVVCRSVLQLKNEVAALKAFAAALRKNPNKEKFSFKETYKSLRNNSFQSYQYTFDNNEFYLQRKFL